VFRWAELQTPDLALPETWPAQLDNAAQKVDGVSSQWWHLYADASLDQLEDEALAHNADIQVAAARMQEVRAQLGITEADQNLSVSANVREIAPSTAK